MLFPEKLSFSSYRPHAWLKVSGEDAATYLQGQFTNDLRPLSIGEAAYGLWLNQKGKVLADSFVIRGKEREFWVGSYFSSAATIRERLEAYVIADEVVIEDATSAWAGIAIIGSGSASILGHIKYEGFVFPGRRVLVDNVECVMPLAEIEKVHAGLMNAGAHEISAVDLEKLRIDSGIPAIPRDIGPGELPNEGGLESVAISYTKGCYLGQEVMARLKSMGQVRRHLIRVAGEGNISALPAALFVGKRCVGELRSAAPYEAGGFIGIALVSLLHVKADAALAFGPEATPTLRLIGNL